MIKHKKILFIEGDREYFEVEDAGECPYELETVEILGIRIEEMDD